MFSNVHQPLVYTFFCRLPIQIFAHFLGIVFCFLLPKTSLYSKNINVLYVMHISFPSWSSVL